MDNLDPVLDEADGNYMGEALREARKAGEREEVPVGAVVVLDGRVIGRAHAEMLALTQAQAALENWRLEGCTLYVTKEPCPMCAGAIVHTRIARVVFGLGDPKAGALGGAFDLQAVKGLNHHFEVKKGVREHEALQLLQGFFQVRRNGKAKNDLPEC